MNINKERYARWVKENGPIVEDECLYDATNKAWYIYNDSSELKKAEGLCRDIRWLMVLKNGRQHNIKGPADIEKIENTAREGFILHWYIDGHFIPEFTGLWYEDLSEAQLKKLEFYKLKYGGGSAG